MITQSEFEKGYPENYGFSRVLIGADKSKWVKVDLSSHYNDE